MPTNMFNEAEKYLVQNWQVACRVKRSMREIRTKYTAIGDRVVAVLPGSTRGARSVATNPSKAMDAWRSGERSGKTTTITAYIAVENLKIGGTLG